jgi:hypothetical protein
MDNNKKEEHKIVRDEKGRFMKGFSGCPEGPGRFVSKYKLGVGRVKQAFLDAFEKTGGVEGLIEWIEKSTHNRKYFYDLLLKLLPKDIDIESKNLDVKVIWRLDGQDIEFTPKPGKSLERPE